MIQSNIQDRESLTTWLPLYSVLDKTENRRPGTWHAGPNSSKPKQNTWDKVLGVSLSDVAKQYFLFHCHRIVWPLKPQLLLVSS